MRKKNLLKQIEKLRKYAFEEIEEFQSEIDNGVEGNQESIIIHDRGHLAALDEIEKCLKYEKETIDKRRIRKELRKISRKACKGISAGNCEQVDFNIGIQCVTNFLRDVVNYNRFLN